MALENCKVENQIELEFRKDSKIFLSWRSMYALKYEKSVLKNFLLDVNVFILKLNLKLRFKRKNLKR